MARTSRRRTSRRPTSRRNVAFSVTELSCDVEGNVVVSTLPYHEGTSKAAAVRGARERAQMYEPGKGLVALTDEKGKIYGVYGHTGRAMPHLISKVRKQIKNVQAVEQRPDALTLGSPLPLDDAQGAALPPEETKEETDAAVAPT